MKGEPCLIQAGGSDVSLRVPKGVHGTITTQTFTDHSKFHHLIREDECLVSPIYKFTLAADKTQDHPKDVYTAKIPHSILNVKKAEEHIRVRQFDAHESEAVKVVRIKKKKKGLGQILMKKKKSPSDTEPSYDIDKCFITVESRSPGLIIVTVEGLNCCSRSASCFLYGSMMPFPDNARVKVYFWSVLGRIKDYETVSKALIKSEAKSLYGIINSMIFT